MAEREPRYHRLCLLVSVIPFLISGCAREDSPQTPTGVVSSNQIVEATARRTLEPVATSTIAPTNVVISGCVEVASLRVRSGPGTEFPQTGGLKGGDCVELDGRDRVGAWVRSQSADWQGGVHGWMAAEYLKTSGVISSLQVLGPPVVAASPRSSATITRKPTATTPAKTPASPPSGRLGCEPSYTSVCLPIGAADYDCAGGSGNGPTYVRGPVLVRYDVPNPDPYGLDRDGDGIGCE
jgi:uncharacterized protein YraI